jgi:hypothetical protein
LRDEFPNPETMAIESQNHEIDEIYKIEKWDPENRNLRKPGIMELSKW